MNHAPPYRFFGWEMAACHGVPGLIALAVTAIIVLFIIETASQFVKPVELTAIWAEPRIITTAQILAQTPQQAATKMHKTGRWVRLCNVVAKQTFIEERGGSKIDGGLHPVKTPDVATAFNDKTPRDLQIPKQLATSVGIWKMQIDNSGACWWLEKFIPIGGMRGELTFEIVP